jgi:GT2 family glycosyltransferase
MKILIVIPIRNVLHSLKVIFRELDWSLLDKINQILFIDNLSSDGSAEFIDSLKNSSVKNSNKIKLIKNSENIGYGGSIKKGIKYALENNYSHIIIQHGDNQTSTNNVIKIFMDSIQNNPDKLVLTTRFKNSNIKEYNILRKLGNFYFNFITKILTGYKLTDPGAAISCIPTKFLTNINLNDLDNHYHFHPQLNLKYFENKIPIVEKGIKWSDSESKSELNLYKYAIKLQVFLIVYYFKKLLKFN